MTERTFEIVLTPPARRAIPEELPEAVAAAIIDVTTTAIINNSHRVGVRPSNDLNGVWFARRGTYRVLYRISQERREVVVLQIDHRRYANRLWT